MRKLNLDQLKLGQAGITPEVGSFMVQAAIVCLVEIPKSKISKYE